MFLYSLVCRSGLSLLFFDNPVIFVGMKKKLLLVLFCLFEYIMNILRTKYIYPRPENSKI